MTAMTWIKLFDLGGGTAMVEAYHEQSIDAAVSKYLDTGRDSIIDLDLIGGNKYRIRASRIGEWIISTPDGRRGGLEAEKTANEEHQAMKAELGVWSEEE